jgi:ATP-dependent DNA helicase RecG
MKVFNPRAMMELAIEQMKLSIDEPRSDGKVSPKVGAVLVNVADEAPGYDRIMKAHRGELRYGDHAEFTLLERKNRDRALDNCVLFATLEPCAPGARRHPKLGCAERIVLARIKQVWIGIEDPDPTVARKGIEYLRKNGVTIHMFDRELQEIIETENRQFLDQALQRADESKKEKKEILLSPLEKSRPAVNWDDLSTDALNRYQERSGIEQQVGTDGFQRLLEEQGLLIEDGNILRPTGFGNVLFGHSPQDSSPQAVVLGTIHNADGTEDTEDFDGPQVLVPSNALDWIKSKLPNVIDRSEAVRKEKSQVVYTLIREGLVNAIVHRDYDIDQAKCQLVVYPSRVEIHSPGGPLSPITIEQLQNFDAPALSRNPILHHVFARMQLAEQRGLGLKSLREKALESGLPRPKYEWRDPYLVLTIFLTPEAAVSALPQDVLAALNDREREGWQWLASMGSTGSKEYAERFEIDRRTAARHLAQFEELGLVRKVGAGSTTRYEVK